MKRLWLILFVIFIGCVSNWKPVTLELKDGTVLKGRITISHVDKDEFIFDYDLDKKVKMIMLGPQTKEYHESSWRLPATFEITTDEKTNYSYLKRKGNKLFDKVSIPVSTYKQMVTYAPQPFIVFENGVAVNTGPLGYMAKIGLFNMGNNFSPTYIFNPLPNESILVPGNPIVSNSSVKTNTKRLVVYFGSKESINEGENIISIIGKTFPSELKKAYLPFVEKCASFYNQQIRNALNEKLTILLSHQVWEKDGYSFGGGAQEFQIIAKSFGNNKNGVDEERIKKMRLFFAHEMAHLWQTNLGNDDARWFNEGEAELLSLYAMEGLGLITFEDIIRILSENIQESIKGLKNTSLFSSHLSKHPKLNYTAGLVVVYASMVATGADGKADDVFGLDKTLSSISQNDRQNNPMKSFKQTLSSLGATQKAIDEIQSFIYTKSVDPIPAYQKLFDATGVKYTKVDDKIIITQ